MPTIEEIEAKIIENRILANRKKKVTPGLVAPDTFTTTPRPASTLTQPITEKPATPVWAQNLGREVLGLHKVLDPMFEPNWFVKNTIEQQQMLADMAQRYGPVLKFGPGAATGDPSDVVSMGRHGAKMLEQAPLQTLFDVGMAFGIPALAGKGRVSAPVSARPKAIPKTKPVAAAKKPTAKAQQDIINAKFKAIDEQIIAIEEQKLKPTIRLNPAKSKALDKKILELGEQKRQLLEPEIVAELAKAAVSDIDVSIQKVTQALKEAKPARKAQEALYAKERAARLGKLRGVQETTTGEKGFRAELGQLKGELPKVEFESIRGKVSQVDIDNLFNKVKDANILTDWEKITAREGLSKLLAEHGGRVPTKGELTLLEQVFPTKFIETIMGRRPLGAKLTEGFLQAVNIPRSIMASFDLSFGGRQGAFAAPKFRRAFWDSWKKQFKIFGSEKAYKASQEALVADPEFMTAKKSGISFTEIGKILTRREEAFQSQWAEKIPLIGRGVRASGRAYTAFANKYRLDMFKKLIKNYEGAGVQPKNNPFLLRETAQFVNNSTGRGSLGNFENAAVALNAIFFSPRLNMARLRLLNPVYYIRQPKHLRKQALSTALHAAGAATTILAAAKLGGLDVTADPRNADFGKIKIGNTRLDMLAGFGQFIRGAAQITTGEYVSSSTGKVVKLGGGFKPLTRMDLLIRQIESKEAPVASFATGLLRDRNWAGEEFSIPKEVGIRFVPMVVSDIIDLAKDDPSLIPLAVPATFGIGLQTYRKRKKRGLGFRLR